MKKLLILLSVWILIPSCNTDLTLEETLIGTWKLTSVNEKPKGYMTWVFTKTNLTITYVGYCDKENSYVVEGNRIITTVISVSNSFCSDNIGNKRRYKFDLSGNKLTIFKGNIWGYDDEYVFIKE